MSKTNEIAPAGARLSRREFITRSAQVGLAAGTLVIAANVLSACGNSNPPRYVQVGNLADFPAGAVVTKTVTDSNGNNATIFVENLADQNTPLILSSVCSHEGCTVQWVDSENIFGCPCHGGQYNKDGTVKGGPPPAPLAHLQAKVENGALSVLI